MYTNITVRQIFERKSCDVWSGEPNVSVFDAQSYMADMDIGAVVLIEDEKPVRFFPGTRLRAEAHPA